MKKATLLIVAAALLLAAPSCKKQKQQWTKHVVTEEYVYVDPQPNPAVKAPKEKKEKTPKLSKYTAMRLVKKELKKQKKIKTPIVEPIQIGYYECNNATARENLYKIQANGLIDVTYSEIKNKYEQPTYWVDVELTNKGKLFVVRDKKPKYPEDSINVDYMKKHISPDMGKNRYGEYTFDPYVDSVVIDLIQEFYSAYINNKATAINTYGTPDLILADQRIRTAKDLNIKRMTTDPFVRNTKIAQENVYAMAIHKWTTYVDLYVVSIADQQFCVVIKEVNGVKKIDDIALNSPSKINQKRTMRCVAKNISAQELHNALKRKSATSEKPKTITKKSQKPEPQLLFDEYKPVLAPGIIVAEHPEPWPYQIAKECQHIETCNLLAAKASIKKMNKIKDVEGRPLTKTANVTVHRHRVTPIGRIIKGFSKGDKTVYKAVFKFDTNEEEWVCELQ